MALSGKKNTLYVNYGGAQKILIYVKQTKFYFFWFLILFLQAIHISDSNIIYGWRVTVIQI